MYPPSSKTKRERGGEEHSTKGWGTVVQPVRVNCTLSTTWWGRSLGLGQQRKTPAGQEKASVGEGNVGTGMNCGPNHPGGRTSKRSPQEGTAVKRSCRRKGASQTVLAQHPSTTIFPYNAPPP